MNILQPALTLTARYHWLSVNTIQHWRVEFDSGGGGDGKLKIGGEGYSIQTRRTV